MRDTDLQPQWWREGLPMLARMAGIAVLASAIGLAMWDVVEFDGPSGGDQLRLAWARVVGIAVWGVMIILLAEVVELLQDQSDRDQTG